MMQPTHLISVARQSRTLLAYLAAAVASLLLHARDIASAAEVETNRASNPKPNVLIVLADQWRAQAFGFAGDPNVRTPNFDRLAGESARFVNAISGLPSVRPRAHR